MQRRGIYSIPTVFTVLGNKNTMSNYQVMCRICNEKKADTIEKE